MADIKTHLRELSVATTVGLLNSGIRFTLDDLRDSRSFLALQNRLSPEISPMHKIFVQLKPSQETWKQSWTMAITLEHTFFIILTSRSEKEM